MAQTSHSSCVTMRSGLIVSSFCMSTRYKLSPWEECWLTSWSISADVRSRARLVLTTTVFVAASGGKSHSKVTPATDFSKPRAYKISVAEGKNEQICILNLATAHEFSKFDSLEAAFESIRLALYPAILYFSQTRDCSGTCGLQHSQDRVRGSWTLNLVALTIYNIASG